MTDPEASLCELVSHVFQHQDGLINGISYQELAARIGRRNKHGEGHGHGMGHVLGQMGHLLQGLEGEWGEPIPRIQSLVVNKSGPDKGLPDVGIKEFWPDYPRLTRVEKESRVRIEHQRIVSFGSRWNDVLERLKLAPIKAPSKRTIHGAGGESAAHQRLKEFVRANPRLVGADATWEAYTEFPMPSLDEADVFFRTESACIAVEVKAAISDRFPADYERGLYQIVKYRALLDAMRSDGRHRIPNNVRVVLVLESNLPSQYRRLMEALGVEVLESIQPKK